MDYYSLKYLRWHCKPQICGGIPQLSTIFSASPISAFKVKIQFSTDVKTEVKLDLPTTSFKCFEDSDLKSEFNGFVNNNITSTIMYIFK